MPVTITPPEVRSIASLPALIRAAGSGRSQSETYGSPVGASCELADGTIISGFNISMTSGSMHAEVLTWLTGHQQGARSTDFIRTVVLFEDIHHNIQETFAACPGCWEKGHDLTHLYQQIIVVDVNSGKPQDIILKTGERKESVFLGDMFSVIPSQIWPSNNSRINLRKTNQKPKFPLAPHLMEIRRKEPYYDQFCTKVAGFEPLDQEPALAPT